MNEQLWTVCDNPELMIAYLVGEGRFTAHKKQCFKDASAFVESLLGRANLLRCVIGNPFRPAYRWTDMAYLHTSNLSGSGKAGPTYCYLPKAWLTPTVVSLATAAYSERGRVCETCVDGYPGWGLDASGRALQADKRCATCHGTGRVEDGTLDNDRLAVLADALEDAGMPAEEECRRCKPIRKTASDLAKIGRMNDALRFINAATECVGCPGKGSVHNPLLTHLRSEGPHVRGCWAIDALLGKA